MTSTVYKLVQETEKGQLTSMTAEGSYLTVYQPGEWVQKKNLFVFLDARHAVTGIEGLELWECETTTEPRHAPERIPDYEHTYDKSYKGISPELTHQLIAEFFESPLPSSAYVGPLTLLWCANNAWLVDDVRLIRRIDE
jgi:hypothetical protein